MGKAIFGEDFIFLRESVTMVPCIPKKKFNEFILTHNTFIYCIGSNKSFHASSKSLILYHHLASSFTLQLFLLHWMPFFSTFFIINGLLWKADYYIGLSFTSKLREFFKYSQTLPKLKYKIKRKKIETNLNYHKNPINKKYEKHLYTSH
jgi:hypothetical protein